MKGVLLIVKNTQGKIATVVVTDLHIKVTSPPHRLDYWGETQSYLMLLLDKVKELKKDGYKVIIIFLGDIFDKQIQFRDYEMILYDLFAYISETADLYTVVGNHELTYYKDNLFWNLVNSIESTRLLETSTQKAVTPKGYTQKINIVDDLVIGEVTFHFNHYDCSYSQASNKVDILLSHNDYLSKEVDDWSKDEKNQNSHSKYIRPKEYPRDFKDFDYIDIGHNHGLYLDIEIDLGGESYTEIHYLGSIGRPSVGEISNSNLDRMFPIYKIEDGKFVGLEKYKFTLWDEKKCIHPDYMKDKDLDKKRKEMKKEKNKEKKDKGSSNKFISRDPVERIMNKLAMNEERESLLERFNHLLEDDYTKYIIELEEKVDEFE